MSSFNQELITACVVSLVDGLTGKSPSKPRRVPQYTFELGVGTDFTEVNNHDDKENHSE